MQTGSPPTTRPGRAVIGEQARPVDGLWERARHATHPTSPTAGGRSDHTEAEYVPRRIHHPVPGLGPVNGRPKTAPRARTVPQLRQLRAALTYDQKAIARDLPDLVGFLVATGSASGRPVARPGTPSTSRSAPWRCAPLEGWRDPSNTQADLREALAPAGFDWVTSHAFRKTVATLMDHAGLSSRAAADQLGHANTSMATDVSFGRRVAVTGVAAVLEALGT